VSRVLNCRFRKGKPGSVCLSRSWKKSRPVDLSRRKFLQYCQGASLALLPAGIPFGSFLPLVAQNKPDSQGELRLHPEYRLKRGIEPVLRKVAAGFDEFVTEKYQDRIAEIFAEWSSQLLQSSQHTAALGKVLAAGFLGSSLKAGRLKMVNDSAPFKVWQIEYPPEPTLGAEMFLSELRSSLGGLAKLVTAEFQVIHIRAESSPSSANSESTSLVTTIRFELIGTGTGFHREQRIGHWELRWEMLASGEMRLEKWRALDEQRGRAFVPVFQDITSHAFGNNPSYASQLIPGTDHWRTVLDGASGIDIYGHNGVSVGDVDGDGLDDLYICQPAGLPNLLFRNRGDGTFEDITDSSGLGILENTACALFADIDNDGRQDLIVVRSDGPLLFLNQGSGRFSRKPDAFQFASPPQGTFTGAAIADYDRDGWLDIYFCLYAYYQGTDQYRYPMPYYDAENGPPNFMMRNNRDGTFHDVTKQCGMDQNNTRFSFCCSWGDYNGDLWPDLYVANDFGRKNLYRNNGDGTFTDVAREAGVEDVGAGMSVAWLDFDKDGREDLYVADMWTAAGIRISEQEVFQKGAGQAARALYRKHAMGNSLYRNLGERFEDVGARSGTTMGRWSWSSDAWDFNHDGYPDIYIANGMVSGSMREDLNSFFWRQVVANSPNDARPSHEYEQGWNALNELIRADRTWSGFERNVFYLNNGDGTFSDVSGIAGLDFLEDGRTFALGDFDGDGRLEVVLKNRNSPQLRFLKNVLPDLPPAISFRLSGKKSNRDAVGARITVETESGPQSRILRSGSGFLAQHTKEIVFGLGTAKQPVEVTIQWPSGLSQKLRDLPVNHRIWVEEGVPPTRMEPFVKFSSLPALETSSTPADDMEKPVETWLLVPVLAPDFSLRDLGGRSETLSARRGKAVLLHFWSASLAGSGRDLEEFEQSHEVWARKGLQLLTINVDAAQGDAASRAQVPAGNPSFPIVNASQDVIATYNLLYRQLFDRHRDMSVPSSFLVDPGGNIVKIYRGQVLKTQFEADFQSMPRSDSERLSKALPFAGVSESYEFERNYLSLGFVFFERGYFEQAEAFFEQALKNDPKSAEALYGLGSAYLQQQKPAEARDCFRRALQLHASYPGTLPNAWNNLGILDAREGKTDLAIEHFQRALQIDPEHTVALQNLGSAYRQKKDWPQAKRMLERALALNPDDPEANYSLGMVYAQQNDTERAYDYLQKALASRPDYPEALNNLGILYLRTRRPEEAKRSFEESVRVAPAYDQAYLNLARVYVIEGDREKAKAVLLELLKQHPDHAQANEALKQLQQ
jgi:tetratricopeptide (TPR) repeat protein/peroxiredoxin